MKQGKEKNMQVEEGYTTDTERHEPKDLIHLLSLNLVLDY